MSIIYHQGDLFTAPQDHVLLHAVNCQGSWGAGVAKQFAEKFPKSFEWYNWKCVEAKDKGRRLVGEWNTWLEKGRQVAWLYTSNGYGAQKDPAERILQNTHKAVTAMLYNMEQEYKPAGHHIASPKINAGLFGVPWEDTEQVIKDALKWYPSIYWHVWEL